MKKYLLLVIGILFLLIPNNVWAYQVRGDKTFYEITEKNITTGTSIKYMNMNYATDWFSASLSGKVHNQYITAARVTKTLSLYDFNFALIAYSSETNIFKANSISDFIISVPSSNDKVADARYYTITNTLVDFVYQEEGQSSELINTYGNGEYALTKYKIDIIVNENNSMNITEYITAHFNVYKHGIFRKLPLRNQIVRLDGSKSYNRAVKLQLTNYNALFLKILYMNFH